MLNHTINAFTDSLKYFNSILVISFFYVVHATRCWILATLLSIKYCQNYVQIINFRFLNIMLIIVEIHYKQQCKTPLQQKRERYAAD